MKELKMIDNLVKEMNVKELRVENLDIPLMDFLAERLDDTTIYNLAIRNSESLSNVAEEAIWGTALDIAMRVNLYKANVNSIKLIHIIDGEWYLLAEY